MEFLKGKVSNIILKFHSFLVLFFLLFFSFSTLNTGTFFLLWSLCLFDLLYRRSQREKKSYLGKEQNIEIGPQPQEVRDICSKLQNFISPKQRVYKIRRDSNSFYVWTPLCVRLWCHLFCFLFSKCRFTCEVFLLPDCHSFARRRHLRGKCST